VSGDEPSTRIAAALSIAWIAFVSIYRRQKDTAASAAGPEGHQNHRRHHGRLLVYPWLYRHRRGDCR